MKPDDFKLTVDHLLAVVKAAERTQDNHAAWCATSETHPCDCGAWELRDALFTLQYGAD